MKSAFATVMLIKKIRMEQFTSTGGEQKFKELQQNVTTIH
jgi:hypothetical protein